MKRLKEAVAEGCALSLVCEEAGKEETVDILIDVAHIVVTSQSYAMDIMDAESYAEEKRIPELTLIPYHPLYQSGYADERYLVGAADALRFYRGDPFDEVLKKLSSFCPRPYQTDPSLKVIDFDLRGTQVILYLGKADLDNYGGEGWDEAPYDFCAEKVEDAYIADSVVLNFPADASVFQACDFRDTRPDQKINGNVSKNELRRGEIPCILYSLDGRTYGEIHFDDAIGEVVKEANVPVSKFEHMA